MNCFTQSVFITNTVVRIETKT
ncbi:hypothetical protein B4U80_10499 [Leptotrombidium deliense]|uniref:Uncharacterized protein n=1 Tax=Leptotrombidium deliense TaxID=299467 RepID=A0A443Q7T2_9ACAR|nr:hypothetical protein B4U80_10499 [Leptotrombidium deliense]